MTEITVKDIRGLTTVQYDGCKETAKQRIKDRAGEKPARRDFARQLEPLWNVLDLFALAVGVSAWLVSNSHILTHSGQQAAASYQIAEAAQTASNYIGDLWEAITFGRVHQVGFMVLAEAAMILFMVMHNARHVLPQQKGETLAAYRTRRYFSIPLVLALLSAAFVFYANVTAGVGPLESILPPAVTIGLGLYFEQKLSQQIARQRDVTGRYLAALGKWEAAQSANIEEHPDYLPFLRQELAQKLLTLKPQKDYPDVPVVVIRQAVARELYRDQWAYETLETTAPAYTVPNPTHGAEAAPSTTPAPALVAVERVQAIPTTISPSRNGNGNHH